MYLPIRDMAYFLAVADAGQLAQVAGDLGLSSAALSKSIRRLEVELGLRLFERSVQGMQLTAFGLAFAERARRTCTEYNDALRYATDVRTGRAGLLRIGASVAILEALVAPALAKLQPKRPAMRAQITTANSDTVVERLRRGSIDVAVVPAYDAAPQDLAQTFIGQDSFVPVVRSDHPLLALPHLRGADLRSYSWILPSDHLTIRSKLNELFVKAGLEIPVGSIEVDAGTDWTLSVVRSTDMISYVPHSQIDPLAAHHVHVLPLRELVLKQPMVLLLRTGAYWSPLISEFVQLLSAETSEVAGQ